MSVMLILDDFLDKQDPLYKDLTNASNWTHTNKYHWMEKDQNPSTCWEKLNQKIWSHQSVSVFLPKNYQGIEYWIDQKDGEFDDCNWHIDSDEYAAIQNQQLLLPAIGSIYYAHTKSIQGGKLEINRRTVIDQILPIPNRLVIFESGRFIHRISKGNGKRNTIVSNVWINKPHDKNYTEDKFRAKRPQQEYKLKINANGRILNT